MSTTASDNELSAVNSILGSIGQSPLPTTYDLSTNTNPEIQLIQNILNETNKDIQNEGWHFNHEEHVEVTPTNNEIAADASVLRYDLHDDHLNRSKDLIVKDGKLYDKANHSSTFTGVVYLDITTFIEFAKVPPPVQRYIVASAAVRAAAQLVSNTELVKLLNINKEKTKATALEFDCQTGDHSFFGLSHDQAYRAYQPYNALAR